MSMEALRGALLEFYSPNTSQEIKNEIEKQLTNFKRHPDVRNVAFQILQMPLQNLADSDLYLLYFAGSALEELVQKKWQDLPSTDHRQLRRFLFSFVVDSWGKVPKWVLTKLHKTLVDIGKHTWPQDDSEFLSDVLILVKQPQTRSCGLFLFALAVEEYIKPDLLLVMKRKSELHNALRAAMPSILLLMTDILIESLGSISVSQAASCDAMMAALRSLEVLLGWTELSQVASPEMLSALFKIVEVAAKGYEKLSDCSEHAIVCITEILGKRRVPTDLQPLVLQLAHHMLTVLRLLTDNNGAKFASASESFIFSIVELLNILLELHLPRIIQSESGRNFPVGDLLSLLANFTFQQRDCDGFKRCLLPWTAFITMITEADSEYGEMAALAQQHSEGLRWVCEKLLEKALFMTNAEGLSQLEETEISGSTGNRSAVTCELLPWNDSREMNCLGDNEESLSELDEFVNEISNLLTLCSRLPQIAHHLGVRALSLFSLAASSPSTTSASADRLVRDATTLCSLIGGSGGEQACLEAASVALGACNSMQANRSSQFGPSQVRLIVALLDVMARLAPNLTVSTSGVESVNSIISIVASILDHQASAHENVVMAAIRVLRMLSTSKFASELASNEKIGLLIQAGSSFGGAARGFAWLSPRTTAAVYGVLAGGVLLPSQCLTGPEIEKLSPRYERRLEATLALARPSTTALIAATSVGIDFEIVNVSAMILVAFCRTLGSAPAPGKAALNRAVIPGLEAIPALIAPCLHESAHNPTAGTCSSTLLTLLAASASALSLDSANSPIFEALDILVALSFTDVAYRGIQGQLLLTGVFRLLTANLASRSPRITTLAPRAASFALQMFANCPDGDGVMPEILAVIEALLSYQRHCFISGRLHDASVQLMSGETGYLFIHLCTALCHCIWDDKLVDVNAAKAISVLCNQNKVHKLFKFMPFVQELLIKLLQSVIMSLIRRNHPLLTDELTMLAIELAGSDQVLFVTQFLFPFVENFHQLNDNQWQALAHLFPPPPAEEALFERAMSAFINDLQFFLMIESE